MKILITGAAGFVGSHVLKKAKELGLEVLGIDNFSNYYSPDYKKLRLEYLGINLKSDLHTCDISIFEQVQTAVRNFEPEYIVHLAAQAGVRLTLADSDQYISANVKGFHNLIRSSIENNVKGILYASSSSVYGDSLAIPYSENTSNLKPKSIYGVTKLCNEMYAEIQSKASNLRLRGLRYFTIYGPWGRPDMAYFRLAAAVLNQGRFTLYGNGSIKRDFTYIDDVVDNTLSLLQDLILRDESFSDIVNIGGGRPLDMNYLIGLISKKGSNNLDLIKANESKYDSRITMADNSYLKSILGDLKFTDLEQGVERLMSWASQENIKPNLGEWSQSSV